MVQFFLAAELIKTHPRKERGKATDFGDYPPEKIAFHMRTPNWCRRRAAEVGPACEAVIADLLAVNALFRLRTVPDVRTSRPAARSPSAAATRRASAKTSRCASKYASASTSGGQNPITVDRISVVIEPRPQHPDQGGLVDGHAGQEQLTLIVLGVTGEGDPRVDGHTPSPHRARTRQRHRACQHSRRNPLPPRPAPRGPAAAHGVAPWAAARLSARWCPFRLQPAAGRVPMVTVRV
jgi:hypothetical protein